MGRADDDDDSVPVDAVVFTKGEVKVKFEGGGNEKGDDVAEDADEEVELFE